MSPPTSNPYSGSTSKLYDPYEGSSFNTTSNAAAAVKPNISNPDRGASKTTKSMDPFEVRIRFTQHLQHLNASVTSANKAAQYALKYRDMDEDLHSCILEQLERVCFSLSPKKLLALTLN
jgi:CTD kinase subunit gamma